MQANFSSNYRHNRDGIFRCSPILFRYSANNAVKRHGSLLTFWRFTNRIIIIIIIIMNGNHI